MKHNPCAPCMMMAILTLIIVFALISILCARPAGSSEDPDVYVVKKGDTLWGICRYIYGDMKDTRKMVYMMRKLNEIEDPGELQPGMELYLPIAN